MGLITGLQDEAERVQRRADQQVALGNRRIVGQNAQATTLKGELAPLEEIIKHYNTVTVPAYNTSVANYNGGFLGGGGGYWPDRYTAGNWLPMGVAQNVNYRYSANSPSVSGAGYIPTRAGEWADGTPIYTLNKYSTPAALDSSAATAANAGLTARQSDIDALNASGKSIERRNGLMAQRSEREGERLNTSIEMNKTRIAQEQQAPQQSTSVFDQNMAGIHQSISDWLNA